MPAKLLQIYREVDAVCTRLAARHRDRLKCGRGCSDCCVDELTVFEVEADRIRARHADLLRDGRPHPAGACAFLDRDGACRIYESRPYVCRTQGLPLRWLSQDADGMTVEYRDICPLNEPGEPLVDLWPEDCWELGPIEGELGALQSLADGGERRRVALRSLFVPHDE